MVFFDWPKELISAMMAPSQHLWMLVGDALLIGTDERLEQICKTIIINFLNT